MPSDAMVMLPGWHRVLPARLLAARRESLEHSACCFTMLDVDHPSGFWRQKAATPEAASKDSQDINDWLFALLRFAVTKERADRASAMAVAQKMDQRGLRPGAQFSFFTRTSETFCNDADDRQDLKKLASLRRFVEQIGDNRLRRAFEVILQIGRPKPSAHKIRRYDHKELFKGLLPSKAA
jgi:hypothetical protein